MKKWLLIITLAFGLNLTVSFADDIAKNEPLCAFMKDSLWHFVDHQGNEMFAPKPLADVRSYSEGKFRVQIMKDYRKSWAYMDTKGKLLFGKDFDQIYDFQAGMAVVMKYTDRSRSNVLYGLIDSNGKQILPIEFDDMSNCSEGWIYTKKGRKFCYYDKTGKEVLDISPMAGSHFSDGRAAVTNRDYMMGFIDRGGKVVVDLMYEEAKAFSEGLAAVTKDGMTGYCNKEGKMKIDPKFENVTEFKDNRAFMGIMNQDFITMWGMIDNEGGIINRLIYEAVFNFSEGLAAVKQDKKWGYIHPHGDFIAEPNYSYALSFNNGIAWVSDYENKKYGYIDKTFDYVIEIEDFEKLVDLRQNIKVIK
jgi:WG repeat protein